MIIPQIIKLPIFFQKNINDKAIELKVIKANFQLQTNLQQKKILFN